MNRGQAIAIIKQTLAFKTTHDAEIGAALDDAQQYLERNWPAEPLPWFLLSERSETSAVPNEERIPLPSDFIQEVEGDALWLQLDSGGERPLTKFDSDDARLAVQKMYNFGEIAQPTDDTPTCYALTGNYFRLFPKPLTAVTVKMMYYKTISLTVGLTDENDWLKHSAYSLIGFAGERMATAFRDAEAKQTFMGWKEAGILSLANRNIERQLANRRMAMGETR